MGALRPKVAEGRQVRLLDHQAFPVLFQEEADPGRGRGIAQVLNVGNHLAEVEKLFAYTCWIASSRRPFRKNFMHDA
jgi:hypothetical protein